MDPKYLYLLLNILTFIVPFTFSFYPKANFSKKWKYVLPAIILNAIFFVVWDEIFTRWGVWGFNPQYISGIFVFNLPLEEVLFFFAIPYACIFTYFALTHLIEKDHLFPHQEIISSLLIIVLLVMGFYHAGKAYTAVTFLLTGFFLAWHLLKIRSRYMGRFYFAYIFLLIPFFIVNGILTGSFIEDEVVWYNNTENLGVRIGTIPVEDFIYALLMIIIPVTIAGKLEELDSAKRKARNDPGC